MAWQFLVTGMAGRGGSWWIWFDLWTAVRSLIWLCRFLVQSGGMSGTVTTEQTTGLPTVALSRYKRRWRHGRPYCVFGARSTATTATLNYTNQSGTAGRTSQPIVVPASAAARILFLFARWRYGVRSVEGLTLAGSTGTAGNFGCYCSNRSRCSVGLVPKVLIVRRHGRCFVWRRYGRDPARACLSALFSFDGQAAEPSSHCQLRVIMA